MTNTTLTPSDAPHISFIIPLYNHLAQTRTILDSLQATLPSGLACEIILIDDASSDNTRNWLETLDIPNFKVLINTENMGYAATNNKAGQSAIADIIAFLNNDR